MYFKNGVDKNSQLCVWVGGQCVIDLVGASQSKDGGNGEVKYDANSVTDIFSSGKSVASVLIAMMVDEGRLKYEDPVCKYWPKFGQNGK